MTGDDTRHLSALRRRAYLTAVGGGITTGLAGCIGNTDNDGGSDSNGDENSSTDDTSNTVDSLSFLTWNISFLKKSIMGWIEDFKNSGYENTEVNWLDKPGADLPTYYQTQIQAGRPPQAIDTQGAVYSRYASDGVFEPLGKYASKEFLDKFGEKSLTFSKLDGKLYRLPFYQQTNATYYRKQWFEEAGVTPPTLQKPYTTDEYFDAAKAVVDNSDAEYGLTMHQFDYMFWPFFWSEGINILNEDQTEAVFNTPRAVEIVSRFRELTDDGVIPDLTWTERWTPQNQQFGAGNTGMFMSQFAALRPIKNFGSDWVSGETIGVAHAPKNVGYYTAHGWSVTAVDVSDAEKQAAYDLIRVILNDKWQEDFLRKTTVVTGNLDSLRKLTESEKFKSNNPTLTELYELWFEVQNNLVVPPRIPASGQIQEILNVQVGAAALGEKSPQEALNFAEERVNAAIQESG